MEVVIVADGRRDAAEERVRPQGPTAMRRWLAAVRERGHAALTRAERAHEARRTLEAVTPATQRDIGLGAEDATDLPRWQADLPFFMQAGYGRDRA